MSWEFSQLVQVASLLLSLWVPKGQEFLTSRSSAPKSGVQGSQVIGKRKQRIYPMPGLGRELDRCPYEATWTTRKVLTSLPSSKLSPVHPRAFAHAA